MLTFAKLRILAWTIIVSLNECWLLLMSRAECRVWLFYACGTQADSFLKLFEGTSHPPVWLRASGAGARDVPRVGPPRGQGAGGGQESGRHMCFVSCERRPEVAIRKILSLLRLSGHFKMVWQLLAFLETLRYDKKWLAYEIFFFEVFWVCQKNENILEHCRGNFFCD